jgi:hypothetical protein
LVKEQQLDIATVPLALVADQYFRVHLGDGSARRRSRRRLPRHRVDARLPQIEGDAAADSAGVRDSEESAESVEARLRERLVAYSRYRDAEPRPAGARARSRAFYVRTEGGDPFADITQRYKIDVAKLARALEAALRSAKPEVRTMVRERVSLNEQMELVSKTMRRDGRASFFALDCRRRPVHDHRHLLSRPGTGSARADRGRAERGVRRYRSAPGSAGGGRACKLTPTPVEPVQEELLDTGALQCARSRPCCSSPPRRSRSRRWPS